MARYNLDKNDEYTINDKIINALINVEKYEHGTRSLEAFIQLSFGSGKHEVNLADLPTEDELKMLMSRDFLDLLAIDI